MSRTDSMGQASAAGQPAWVEPELATLTSDRFSDPAWLYERKFDGERCLAYRAGDQVRLMTRNQKQVNGTYPELAAALQAQDCADFIVDGEVVAFVGTVGQVAFSEWTSAGQLRHPRFQGLRRDKDPASVIRETA
jgi:bifunctional non-homologous end joining protein LigD